MNDGSDRLTAVPRGALNKGQDDRHWVSYSASYSASREEERSFGAVPEECNRDAKC